MLNNKNCTQNGELLYEAHMLQEILKINELLTKQAYLNNEELRSNTKVSPKNCTKTSMNQDSRYAKRFNDETHETHFEMTSNSVLSLQGVNISSSITVIKMHSKTTLKKTESKSSKFSEADASSRKSLTPSKHSSNKNNDGSKLNVEIDDELGILDLSSQNKCVSSTLKGKGTKILPTRTRNVEDRDIGVAPFSCPFELVEIYSSNKGRSSKNDLCLDFVDINDETNSTRVIPKEDNCVINSTPIADFMKNDIMEFNEAKALDKALISTMNETEANSDANLITIFEANEKMYTKRNMEEINGKVDIKRSDASRETQKYNRKELDDSSIYENDIEKSKLQESCIGINNSDIIENKHFLKRTAHANNIVSTNKDKNLSTTRKGNDFKECQNIDLIPCLAEAMKNNDTPLIKKKCSLKLDDLINNTLTNEQKEEILAIKDNYEEGHRDVDSISSRELNINNTQNSFTKNNSCTTKNTDILNIDKHKIISTKIEKSSLSLFEEEDYEIKCQNVVNLNNSHQSSVSDNNTFNQSSIRSSESKSNISETTFQNGTDAFRNSNSILSLRNINHLIKGKSSYEKKDMNMESTNDKIKIIIEKRENKENDINMDAIGDNSNHSCNENIPLSIIKNKRGENQNSREFCNDITRLKIRDVRNGITTRESIQNSINYEDINVCKMLTKIHEELTCDWHKMERLQMKLQLTVTVESVNSMMMLQLLDKTIARCKSYIHGSNDCYEAELEIAKLLSKYIVELTRIVKVNKATLEDQERRVDQRQLELLQGHHVVQKRSLLNEIILTSNYWANEISCLIKTISCLVKNVIADNEEKENVKNLERYKTMQRRIVNSLSTNGTKQKSGTVRSRNTKPDLVKKESTIETQMSMVPNPVNPLRQSKSKIPTKPLHFARGLEKDKHLNEIYTVDKKVTDSCRYSDRGKLQKKMLNMNSNQYKQSVSRQKHRAPCNQQPVWRPGGAAKIPTSNSAMTLTHKGRPVMHVKEKTNTENSRTSTHKRGFSMDHIPTKKNLMSVEKTIEDNGKRMAKLVSYNTEKKRGPEAIDLKRKPSFEMKDITPSSNIDNFKVEGKRSNTSLKASPIPKPRPRISQPLTKTYNNSFSRSSDHLNTQNYRNTLSCDAINQKNPKESKVLQALEEIIKNTSEKNEDKNPENFTHDNQFQNEIHFISFKEPQESITVKEETMKINEEEPTKDIVSDQCKKSQLNISENCQEGNKVMENFSEKQSVPIISKNSISVLNINVGEGVGNTEVNKNFEDFEPKNHSSFISASGSCIVDFNSSSVDTIKLEASNFGETSVNSISSSVKSQEDNEKSKENNTSQNCDLDFNEKQQKYTESKIVNNLSLVKGKKTKVNSHAVSLSMLKEFLSDQGIDVDLVNKAEKYLKDKQKTHKCLKKKSISFADMPSGIEYDQHVKATLKKETCWKRNLGTDIEKSQVVSDNIKKNFNEISLQPLPRMKDILKRTIKNSNNAYSQTGVPCKISKGLQIIPENDTSTVIKSLGMETQTEIVQRNVCTMTESLPVHDSSTETVKIYYVCKSVATEHVNELHEKNPQFLENNKDLFLKDNFHKNFESVFAKPVIASNSINTESKNVQMDRTDNNSSNGCSGVFLQLLDHMQKEYEKSLKFKDDFMDKLHFDELKTSLKTNRLNLSSEFLENTYFTDNTIKEEVQSPIRAVSSEILAAIQVTAIRAQNVYKDIDMYKRKLKKNLKKRKKETKHEREISKISKTCKGESKNISRSNSIIKIIMQKTNDKENDINDVSKDILQGEVTSFLSETSFDFKREVDENNFKSIETISVVSDVMDRKKVELNIPKKSFSVSVLRKARSLTENFVSEIGKFEKVKFVQKMSGSSIHKSRFCRNKKRKAVAVDRQVLVQFSRNNLLTLVYAIVCSILCCIVFWCLQLTITCDVIF
ncbi:PREDICTED: uncharacterized protein LOC108552076 [Eufriesea mexicana]|uniref:uncharacterized protein LOC108552076 n=1 Tax=Eufriesea mexicana TaxID=516756 RepID=UPI00083C1E73|nr:PREDICTED: uncharacterized protein LOC108552076 [Eufriesea mexicana]